MIFYSKNERLNSLDFDVEYATGEQMLVLGANDGSLKHNEGILQMHLL